jgi:hypothetical protein
VGVGEYEGRTWSRRRCREVELDQRVGVKPGGGKVPEGKRVIKVNVRYRCEGQVAVYVLVSNDL